MLTFVLSTDNGYDFLIKAKGCKDLVKKLVLEYKGTFEEDYQYVIPYHRLKGKTVKGRLFRKDERDRWIHIYFSTSRYSREEERFLSVIQEQKEYLEGFKGTDIQIDAKFKKYFDLIYCSSKEKGEILQDIRERTEVINREMKLCGYFCIVTSAKMSAAEAVDLYKSRDCSEKLFRGDKSYLDGQSMEVYHPESVHSKIFIEFTALIIRNKMCTCLTDRMIELEKKELYDTAAAVKELEKIELIKQGDGVYRLDHAVAEIQKEILKAFNLTAEDIQKKAKILGEELAALKSYTNGEIAGEELWEEE